MAEIGDKLPIAPNADPEGKRIFRIIDTLIAKGGANEG